MSTMLRSISVSSPSVMKFTILPFFWERSRASRAIFWKVPFRGTIRRIILRSCSSRTILSAWDIFFTKLVMFSVDDQFILSHHGLGDHQFAHSIQQLVQPVDLDPNGGLGNRSVAWMEAKD